MHSLFFSLEMIIEVGFEKMGAVARDERVRGAEKLVACV